MMQTMQRGEFMLAGIRVDGDFPGFERKAKWLKGAFRELDQRIAGLQGVDKDRARYFVYHSNPWEGFVVAVEAAGETGLPSDLVLIRIPDNKYEVYPCSGPLSVQQNWFDQVCAAQTDTCPDSDGVHFERYGQEFDFDRDDGPFEVCMPVQPVAQQRE